MTGTALAVTVVSVAVAIAIIGLSAYFLRRHSQVWGIVAVVAAVVALIPAVLQVAAAAWPTQASKAPALTPPVSLTTTPEASIPAANTSDATGATSANTATADGGDTSTDPATPANLTDLQAANNHFWSSDEEEFNINGKSYDHEVRSGVMGACISDYRASTQAIEYYINRTYRTFTTVFGVADDQNLVNGNTKIQVFGDDKLLFTANVRAGIDRKASIPVTGVLRLRIVASREFPAEGAGCAFAAMGDPQVS